MSPLDALSSKSLEIKPQGLLGRQREPLFKQQNSKVLVPVGLAILGVCFYWDFTYSGPYRYLAEWQLKWFGFYSPKLTMLLIFSGLLVGLLAIASAIKLVFRGAERPISETPSVPPAATSAAIQAPAVQPVDQWLQSIRGSVHHTAHGFGTGRLVLLQRCT
jgi:hypothetical protein